MAHAFPVDKSSMPKKRTLRARTADTKQIAKTSKARKANTFKPEEAIALSLLRRLSVTREVDKKAGDDRYSKMRKLIDGSGEKSPAAARLLQRYPKK